MNETKEMLIEKLNNSIYIYGISDERTIEISQKLDIYMVSEQRKILSESSTH
ncbi:aspartyl-phosphate phosphatase Spo0E family protein [uncultured Clostridium sp.]|uniref:aspartyl-phosphate phosphatase Spo0E family protein n=1 Tax=uncultured Clostridium sp. TaxID=59620 RepID=UPI0028E67EFB|nr:aspartyl-phosphate phosphatase Spo0E family protein [uncultured Clostridium sp.]